MAPRAAATPRVGDTAVDLMHITVPLRISASALTVDGHHPPRRAMLAVPLVSLPYGRDEQRPS